MMQPDTTSGAVANEFLGPEQRRDDDGRSQLPVDLDHDAVAQLVQHQDLLRLGEASSHGMPLCLMAVNGDAPVPPS
jgi:hypothetical protein